MIEMKNVYLVRHCEAMGQSADSQLTSKGFEQAAELTELLQPFGIKRMIVSPFTRAIQSIESFCQKNGLPLEIDERLIERHLGLGVLPNDEWLEKYQLTFEDLEIKYGDGESSSEALQRVLSVIEEVESGSLLVSHGGLLSLVLMHYGGGSGFEYFKQLSNPDVYLLTLNEKKSELERLWS